MSGEPRTEDSATFRGGERAPAHRSSLGLSWAAIALGVVMTLISIVALGAVAWLLVRSGVAGIPGPNGGRALVIFAVVSLAASFAFGTWFAVRKIAPGTSVLLGPIVAVIVLVGLTSVAAPFVGRIADYRSVGIALGLIDAPDVGTRASAALDRFVTAERDATDPAGGNAVSAAWDNVRATIWYVVAVVAALIAAATLGAALGRRPAGLPKTRRIVGAGTAAGLVAVASGIAVITVVSWPSIPPVYGALFDFDQSAGPEVGVSLSEVARHPEVMWGRTVTISARVDRALSPHALMLGNDKPLLGDKVLVVSKSELGDLVLLPSEADTAIEEGDVLQVTGVVHEYDVAQLLKSLRVSVDQEAISGYETRAVLVAEVIDADVPIASEVGDQEFSDSAGYDRGVTIDDVATHPEQHLGLTVTVSGEVEEQLLTPHIFVLGDDALLAISKTPGPELFVEATAYVTGEVRLFNLKEIEQELGLDLDDEALRGYEGQPVILVESLLLVK